MKKTASVFLLLVFLFNTAGIFGLFSYLKQEHYESVFKQRFEKMNLVLLTIPKTEKIHWEKKDEIIYRGKFYDVFGKSEDEENIFLHCRMDSREDKMTDAFHNHLEGQQKQTADGKPGNSQVLKTVIPDFAFDKFVWSVTLSSVKISNQISFSCLSGFTSVFSPPPEAV
ncbi:MAG TPA: hypothetical protein VI757_16180 [Bacteroidia bacterium]|nr:hypothetical protein [Bacteroidia bacterium]